MRGDDGGEFVVVASAVVDGIGRRDVVQVGERVGRQGLEGDAGFVHGLEAHPDLHEQRRAVRDAVEAPVADPEPGGAVGVGTELGPTDRPGGAEGALEHDVAVHVDQPTHGRHRTAQPISAPPSHPTASWRRTVPSDRSGATAVPTRTGAMTGRPSDHFGAGMRSGTH